MPKKNVTIDDLAGMVKRGFDETAKKQDLKLLEKRTKSIERRVIHVEGRLENIEKLLIKQHSFQIQGLEKRIKRLEDLFALK